MKVLFCDNHILVVFKEAGISTQAHTPGKISLEEIAKAWVKEKYNKPGNVFLEPIHRLDQAACGLVIFARTSKALSRLQQQMREQKIQKYYQVLVEGHLRVKKARLVHRLTHGDSKALLDPNGKEAILEYEVQQYQDGNTLVEVCLITGRYHQIRAQFALIGHPVVGDTKYGAKKDSSQEGIALQHYKVHFTHPVTGQSISFKNA